MMSKDESFDDV